MNPQLTISFQPVHTWENNPRSRQVLEEHRDDFAGDCWKVLQRLLKGERLRVFEAAQERLSGHLPRRIADLRGYGINICSEMVKVDYSTRKVAEYYMEKEEINRVMHALIEGMRFEKIQKAA